MWLICEVTWRASEDNLARRVVWVVRWCKNVVKRCVSRLNPGEVTLTLKKFCKFYKVSVRNFDSVESEKATSVDLNLVLWSFLSTSPCDIGGIITVSSVVMEVSIFWGKNVSLLNQSSGSSIRTLVEFVSWGRVTAKTRMSSAEMKEVFHEWRQVSNAVIDVIGSKSKGWGNVVVTQTGGGISCASTSGSEGSNRSWPGSVTVADAIWGVSFAAVSADRLPLSSMI